MSIFVAFCEHQYFKVGNKAKARQKSKALGPYRRLHSHAFGVLTSAVILAQLAELIVIPG